MKVIRYVNGKKVQDLNVPESTNIPITTSPVPTVTRIIKQVANPNPQTPATQPKKGCGCGR